MNGALVVVSISVSASLLWLLSFRNKINVISWQFLSRCQCICKYASLYLIIGDDGMQLCRLIL
jgi:hypothetical protein